MHRTGRSLKEPRIALEILARPAGSAQLGKEKDVYQHTSNLRHIQHSPPTLAELQCIATTIRDETRLPLDQHNIPQRASQSTPMVASPPR